MISCTLFVQCYISFGPVVSEKIFKTLSYSETKIAHNNIFR